MRLPYNSSLNPEPQYEIAASRQRVAVRLVRRFVFRLF